MDYRKSLALLKMPSISLRSRSSVLAIERKKKISFPSFFCAIHFFFVMDGEEVVQLEVGGGHFAVPVGVLRSEPDSVLAAVFAGEEWRQLERDPNGRIVLAGSADAFGHLLAWLRGRDLPPADQAEARTKLRVEAERFGLTRLVAALDTVDGVALQQTDNLKEEEGEEEDVMKEAMMKKEKKENRMHERYITMSDDQFVRLINKSKPQVSGADMRRFSLSGMALSDARFFKCDFNGVDLRWAFLGSASLVECDLRNADLRGANVVQCVSRRMWWCVVRLKGGVRAGTNLRYADLTGSDLTGARLCEANVTGANVARANFAHADLNGIIGLNQTKLNSSANWKQALNLPPDFLTP